MYHLLDDSRVDDCRIVYSGVGSEADEHFPSLLKLPFRNRFFLASSIFFIFQVLIESLLEE